MTAYIIKSVLCMLVLWGFYKLALEQQAAHTFKRFFLLASLFLSLTLPLITFTYAVEAIPQEQLQEAPATFQIINPPNTAIIKEEKTDWLPVIFGSIYFLGIALFGFRFGRNLFRLREKITRNEKIKTPSHINVLLTQNVVPHSFLKYIFLPKTEYKQHQIAPEVLAHEQAHVTQKHSWDILFIELLQVVLWFNPLLILIKKSVALNHEFLADQAALSEKNDIINYTNLLFNYSGGSHHTALSSPINYSLTKKRIVMLSHSFSAKKLAVRLLFLLPVLTFCIYFFNQKIVAKPEKSAPQLKNQQVFQEKIVNPLSAKTIKQKDVAGDSIMLANRIPSQKQLIEWENSGQYGVWVDGKRIVNNELKSLTSDAFAYYSLSKLEKNAVNYGKHFYQIDLMTHDYFETHKFLATIKIDENSTQPPTGNQNHRVAQVRAVQGLQKLSVVVNDDKIQVNGKTTTIKNFAKAVDQATANWTNEDYDLHAMNIQFSTSDDSIRKKLNKEYLKTEIYRHTQVGLAPPPPAPPVPPTIEDFPEPQVPPAPPTIGHEPHLEPQVVRHVEVVPPAPPTPPVLQPLPEPPAPPAPPSPEEMIKEMTKVGADFYYNGDKITPKKAKELFNEKENLNFRANKSGKGDKPTVFITNN
mgnify:CR=1 FL=1|tara:strand:+ start:158110 stop:160032 length:1923 start_codon:yes stop_codon:yes gene_type:complete